MNSGQVQTEFQKPHQLLSFSLNENHDLEYNDSALKYFVEPPHNADLNHSYERWIKRPEQRPRLDNLLDACFQKEARRERKRANVITWRGIMTKLFTAAYERRDGWALNAMLVGDTLYLEEHLEPAQIRQKENLSEEDRRRTYYGYAFESFCTRSNPNTSPDSLGWGGDVDTNVQWCAVVKTKLNDLRIILGGEVDCVRGRYTRQTDNFVELKTSLEFSEEQRDKRRWEMKLLKFFTQSFLLGVPEIVVGFRDKEGYIKSFRSLETASIPRLVRSSTAQWDPQTCQVWALRALLHMREVLSHQAYGSRADDVWRVTHDPKTGMHLRKLDPGEVEASVRCEEDRVGFLPRSYWEAINIG